MTSLFLLLLASTALIATAKDSSVAEVEELLRFGDTMDFGSSSYIVLLGSSGVGKSTLAKFLVRDSSLMVFRKGRSFVYYDNSTISGITRQSKTLLPNHYKDLETGQVIVDMPGFSDTREPKYEIAAAYFIKKVMESAEKLKIVVVENMFSLTEGQDRYGLTRLIKHTAELIPDMTLYNDSVGLIATKASFNGLTDEELIQDVVTYLETYAIDLAEEIQEGTDLVKSTKLLEGHLKFLETMIGSGDGSNVGLFYRPNKEGTPWESYLTNKSWILLRKLIFETLAYKKVSPEMHFKYSLSTDAQVFVKENLLNTTNDVVLTETRSYLTSLVTQMQSDLWRLGNVTIGEKIELVQNNKHNFDKFVTGIKHLEDIKSKVEHLNLPKTYKLDKLNNCLRKAEFFHGVLNTNGYGLLADIRIIFNEFGKTTNDYVIYYNFLQDLKSKLDSYLPQLNRKKIFKTITAGSYKSFIFQSALFKIDISNKEALYDITPDKSMLRDMNQVMKEHLNYGTSYEVRGNDIFISGKVLLTSELNKGQSFGTTNHLQKIHLLAEKVIYIDEGLSVLSANIFLVAPKIEAIKTAQGVVHTIETLGAPSTENLGKAPNCAVLGQKGGQGRRGVTGGKAGDIFIGALEIVSPSNVQIKSTGGRGGKGQTGGEGCAGKVSPFPDYIIPDMPEVGHVLNQYNARGYVTSWNEGAVDIKNFQLSIYPSVGGKGGEGGPGGSPGSIQVEAKEKIDGIVKRSLSYGASGESGEGGRGGTAMPKCAQVHVFCQRNERKEKTKKFNLARFNCQWFRNGCDIIVSFSCKYVSHNLCTKMTPDGATGENGGSDDRSSEKRVLPPQENADLTLVKKELEKLASENGNPEFIKLKQFIELIK
ncbi:uncharacterized protein LOC132203929 [Neocloeon triangulifer]|uniref:uncharacterized protein LOC132203929 n=1 Tax=Neocloeon triangulifer TaxID=2078957 RepID=UPI00286F4738|nr:uncharacterized protein LOC132203929 [Neocloeon triangulifer]